MTNSSIYIAVANAQMQRFETNKSIGYKFWLCFVSESGQGFKKENSSLEKAHLILLSTVTWPDVRASIHGLRITQLSAESKELCGN